MLAIPIPRSGSNTLHYQQTSPLTGHSSIVLPHFHPSPLISSELDPDQDPEADRL